MSSDKRDYVMIKTENRLSITIFFLGLILSAHINAEKNLFSKIARPDYEIHFTPTWISLDDPHHMPLFKETAWVQVGILTIRMKDPSHLHSLVLKWIGKEPIEIHSASLYRGYGKVCKATDDYLIADGQWHINPPHQLLIFYFPTAEKLYVSNTFYLVLTITRNSEKIVSKGTFQILPNSLPSTLQKCLQQVPVYLTFAPPLIPSLSHIT
jgi:hypothetical protein